MRYAIIAAGEGSRLVQEGIAVPKPLIQVGGESLVERLVRIFSKNGASEICIICRSEPQVESHLNHLQKKGEVPLRYIVRTTPSSMHSLYELSTLFEDDEPFVLTTVDTVFREEEFQDYLTAFEKMIDTGTADGLMGVTDYIDDEKPLYVSTDDKMNILAFLDHTDQPRYISGGIYGLTAQIFATLKCCIERGESRMRNFQRALLTDCLRLKAWQFSKVLDIDHASDIVKAETFIKG